MSNAAQRSDFAKPVLEGMDVVDRGPLGGDEEGGVFGKACGERTERFVSGRATGPGARDPTKPHAVKIRDQGRLKAARHPVVAVAAEEVELLPDRW